MTSAFEQLPAEIRAHIASYLLLEDQGALLATSRANHEELRDLVLAQAAAQLDDQLHQIYGQRIEALVLEMTQLVNGLVADMELVAGGVGPREVMAGALGPGQTDYHWLSQVSDGAFQSRFDTLRQLLDTLWSVELRSIPSALHRHMPRALGAAYAGEELATIMIAAGNRLRTQVPAPDLEAELLDLYTNLRAGFEESLEELPRELESLSPMNRVD